MPSGLKAVSVGFLAGILGLILLPITIGLEEDSGLGLLFKMRGARGAPSDVVVVTIDKASSDKLEQPSEPEKWSRAIHARLIENLVKGGAEVIAFDIFFNESRSHEDDRLFADAMRNAGNVVLCECLRKEAVPLTDKEGAHKGNLDIEKLIRPISAFQAIRPRPGAFPPAEGARQGKPVLENQKRGRRQTDIAGCGIQNLYTGSIRRISPSVEKG